MSVLKAFFAYILVYTTEFKPKYNMENLDLGHRFLAYKVRL